MLQSIYLPKVQEEQRARQVASYQKAGGRPGGGKSERSNEGTVNVGRPYEEALPRKQKEGPRKGRHRTASIRGGVRKTHKTADAKTDQSEGLWECDVIIVVNADDRQW